MKTIFFSELNLLNIILIIFFKLLRFKVYFISINKKLRNIQWIKIIEKLGIIWFSYQNYSIKNSDLKINVKNKKFTDKYSKMITELIWNKNLTRYFIEPQNLNICLHQNFLIKLENLCEISGIATELSGENKKYVWAPNNFLSEKIFKESNIKNLCPRYLTLVSTFSTYVFKITKLILFFLKNKIFLILKLDLKENKKEEKNKFDTEIIFFPHCGVIMPNFKKNHYYSENKESPFYYSKIIHVDWDKRDKRITKETCKFYSEKKISTIYWNELNRGKRKYNLKEISFFVNLFFILTKKFDFIIAFDFLSILIKIEESKRKLANFKNLKIILIGYELVFPQEIAVACRFKNIKLVANQERPVNPLIGYQYILDKYFAHGKESNIFFLNNLIDKKMEIINTGIVRMNYHLKEQKILKIENEEKFNLKCLVVDFHSIDDWYYNGREHTINWKKNLLFYKDIISLAQKNRDIIFLIKSKNYKWLKIKYFHDILEIINRSSNIKILNDFEKWTPSNCIKNIDFGIVLTRSLLGDEILAHNKPIIVFNKEYHEFSSINYGSDIVSQDFKDLDHKVSKIKLDLGKYNQNLDLVRKKLLTTFNQKNFSDLLESIYNEKNYNTN